MSAPLLQAARVRQNCSGSGLANLNLLAPISSFQGFADAFPVGSKVTYVLQDGDGTKWEIGKGTLVSTTELSRDTVYSSSASTGYQHNLNPAERTKINLSANTHQVFNSIPPELMLFLDDTGKIADPTPVRATIFVPTITAMCAEVVPATGEVVTAIGRSAIGDGEGGIFRWDPADANAPDNIDTFRNANSSTGLYKRVRLDPPPLLVYETTTALRAVDAAAQFKPARRALVQGRAAAGDCKPFYVLWDPSSSAAHDGAIVFRPTTGAAATGNGRWLRSAITPNQAFGSGDATPSVAGGDFFTTAGATSITDFDDAFEGQEFDVERGDADIALVHNASQLDLGGENITLSQALPRLRLRNVGGVHRVIAAALSKAAVTALSGFKIVATYAAMTALTAQQGLAENLIVCTYSRSFDNDGGFGFWKVKAGTGLTADGGTILSHDSLSFQFERQYDLGDVHVGWWGAAPSVSAANNATRINAAVAALPTGGGWVNFGSGTYNVSSTILKGDGTMVAQSTRHGVKFRGKGRGSANTVFYGGTTLKWLGATGGVLIENRRAHACAIEDMRLDGGLQAHDVVMVHGDCLFWRIKNCTIINPQSKGIAISLAPDDGFPGNAGTCVIENCEIIAQAPGASCVVAAPSGRPGTSGDHLNGLSRLVMTACDLSPAMDTTFTGANPDDVTDNTRGSHGVFVGLVDNCTFTEVCTLPAGGSTGKGLYLNGPIIQVPAGGSFPQEISFYNCPFIGNVGGTPGEGGVRFDPYPTGDGQTFPTEEWIHGRTYSNIEFDGGKRLMRLRQRVSAQALGVFSTTSTSYVDVTGLSVSITPKNPYYGSKLRVVFTCQAGKSTADSNRMILNHNGATIAATERRVESSGGVGFPVHVEHWIDSPTLGANTVKVQARSAAVGTAIVELATLTVEEWY